MSNIRLIQYDERRQPGFDDIYRTQILASVSLNEFVHIHMDPLFAEYLEQYKLAKHTDMSVYLVLDEVFSGISFGKTIVSYERDAIEAIVQDPRKPLDEEQWKQLIGRLQQCLDNYTESQGITHWYIQKHKISESPLAYGVEKFLQEITGSNFPETLINKVANKNIIAYTINNFFSDFLANKLFKKTKESVLKEQTLHENFSLVMTFHECCKDSLTIIATITNEQERDRYTQAVYAIMNDKTLKNEQIQEYISLIEDVVTAYENDTHIDIKEIQSQLCGIITHCFSKIIPSLGAKNTVFLKPVGSIVHLLHHQNFYFDTPILTQANESEKFIDIFGMQGHMDGNYRNKSIDQLIKDANIFHPDGTKLWRGDIDLQKDLSALTGTYYILDQQDGFCTNKEAIVSEQKLPDSDAIKKRFPMFPISGDLTEPTALLPLYIRIKAKYKIQNGELIPNIFL